MPKIREKILYLVEVGVVLRAVTEAVLFGLWRGQQLVEDVKVALAFALAHHTGFLEQICGNDTASGLTSKIKLNVHVLTRGPKGRSGEKKDGIGQFGLWQA